MGIHELHFFTAFLTWGFLLGFSTSISAAIFGSVLYLYLSYAVWTLQYVNSQWCSRQLLKDVDIINRSDVSIRIGVVILALETMDGIVEQIIPVSLMNTLVVYGSSHHIAWGACCLWNNVKHINFCPAGWRELMTKSCRLQWLLENIEDTDTCGVVNAEKKTRWAW